MLPGQRDGSSYGTSLVSSRFERKIGPGRTCPIALYVQLQGQFLRCDDMRWWSFGCRASQLCSDRLANESRIILHVNVVHWKPGDAITFLKKSHVLHLDSPWWENDVADYSRHVTQLGALLGMYFKTQSKKSSAHARIDQEDTSDEFGSDASTVFRTMCCDVPGTWRAPLPVCHQTYLHVQFQAHSEKLGSAAETLCGVSCMPWWHISFFEVVLLRRFRKLLAHIQLKQ